MTQLLKLKELEAVLKKYNLRDLSEGTLIPYDTLKNYSSGRTSLDSIPYRYLKRISDFENFKDYDFFPVSNLIVTSRVFDKMVKEYRSDFNPYYEFLHCIESVDRRFATIKDGHDIIYYFIDSNIFANKEFEAALGYSLFDKLLTILSVGIVANVRIILRDNKDIYRNEVAVSNALDALDYTYESIIDKLELTPKQELSELKGLTDKKLVGDLITLFEYVTFKKSLNMKVAEKLNSIDNITVDIFK